MEKTHNKFHYNHRDHWSYVREINDDNVIGKISGEGIFSNCHDMAFNFQLRIMNGVVVLTINILINYKWKSYEW
jgi:hypothetical protein